MGLDSSKYTLDQKVEIFRRLFHSRTDLFYRKKYVQKMEQGEDGRLKPVQKATYQPACANFWDENLCLIRQQPNTPGNKCRECSNKKYAELTPSVIKDHIAGNKIITLLPITEHGIRFGAIDVDYAVEDDQEVSDLAKIFKDAVSIRDFCIREYGIYSHIARSSNKGFHIYYFFSDYIPAHYFTSLANDIIHKMGFVQRAENFQDIRLPEVFPKQTTFNAEKAGNGIAVPMIEPYMKNGRNCWYRDDQTAVPFDEQWAYMDALKVNDKEYFLKMLQDKQIDIFLDPVRRKKTPKQKLVVGADGTEQIISTDKPAEPGSVIKYQSGSFWSVIAGCNALSELWAKDPANKDSYAIDVKRKPKSLNHNERFASLSIALSTKDGEEVIKKRWPTSTTESIIQHAKEDAQYRPVSCQWMQENGVCSIASNKIHPKYKNGDKYYCLKKQPPTHTENGRIIVNPENLPEEEWAEPSPIRFATEKSLSNDELIERAEILIKAMKKEWSNTEAGKMPEGVYNPDNIDELIKSLFARIAKRSPADRNIIQTQLIAKKILTKSEINMYLKTAKIAVAEEKENAISKANYHFRHKGANYYLKDNKIIRSATLKDGTMVEDEFSNFWVERIAERATINEVEVEGGSVVSYEDRQYVFDIHVGSQTKRVNMENEDFASSSTFFKELRKSAGTNLVFNHSREDYDVFMKSINAFSKSTNEIICVREIGYTTTKNEKKYVMPSVVVSADSIEYNMNYQIMQAQGSAELPFDFKIIDEDMFKTVCRSIVRDYFNCNNPMLTHTAFGHAMASLLIPHIEEAVGYRKAPVLWVAGTFGHGKSFVLDIAAQFFCPPSKYQTINMGGSAIAITAALDAARDATAFVDDVKELQKGDMEKIIKAVQTAYDRSARPALNRDGSRRKLIQRCRGLLTISGEDYPEKEASAVSRLILVDTEMEKRVEEGGRVQEVVKHYCGFTPYVIKHILGTKPEELAPLWKSTMEEFKAGSEVDKDNALQRIAENLTFNFMGFYMGIDAMVAYSGLNRVEATALINHHKRNLLHLRQHAIQQVFNAKASTQFFETLRQLLTDITKFKIIGMKHFECVESEKAKPLGFWSEKTPNAIMLLPDVCVAEVSRVLNGKKINSTHLSRQIAEEGAYVEELFTETSKKTRRNQIMRSSPITKNRVWVWPIKAELLGYDMLSSSDTKSATISQIGKKTSSEDPGFLLE